MRPWLFAPLAALALLAVSASPSFAAFAHGLECTAVGSATVSSSTDESSLSVSNIGSSGQDGVSISLYKSSGHGVEHAFVWDSVADLGGRLSYSWEQLSGPTAFSCDVTRTSSGVTLGGSLWVSGGALYLYGGDLLVLSGTLSVGGSLEVSGMSSSSKIPDVAFETDGKRDLVLCSVSFDSPVTINGVSCDRAVAVADMNLDGELDVCVMRVTNPPGGSLSSLTVSSQSLFSRGSSLTSLGQLHFSEPVAFSSAQGRCNIGSSGQDGVSISESPLSIVLSSSSGPGGGGGGGCAGGQCSSWSSSRPSMMSFPPGTLVFRPGTDDGASLRCDVTGSSSCSPDGVVASLTTLCRSTDLLLSSSFSSMCADAESVHVSLNGVIVSSTAITLGGSVSVTPVTGGPLGMAINEKGLPGASKPKTKPKTVTYDENGDPVNLVTVTDELSLRVQFADQCRIQVAGDWVLGDGVTFTGHRLSGGSPTVVVTGTNFRFAQSSTGTQVPSTVDIQDVSSNGGDQVSAMSPPTGGLSTTATTVQVPVLLQRVDTTPARGYSVTVQLSSNLVLSSSVVEYDYLSLTGATQLYVTDAGNNRYIVDCTILGDPCGSTGTGVLFTLPVSAAPGATDGTGTMSIESVELRSCDNDPLPCGVGSSAYIVIDRTAPSPATSVTATQVTTGNPTGATTAIQVQCILADATNETTDVYRTAFGNYPEYDDAPGSGAVPSPPSSSPPGASWSLVNLPSSGTVTPCFVTSGQCLTDHPSSRDFYYYTVVVRDRFGNVSAPSSMTTGTLNYHLGDNSDGVATCSGDNHVDVADISALGSSYGATLSSGSPLSCLDVGPTTNHRVSGRPMTDNKLNFEDLIISSINFGRVSAPADGPRPVAAATNSLRLLPVTFPAVGETFEAVLAMTAAGDLQGMSAQLDYDPARLELLSVSAGELLSRQDRGGIVLSGGGGVVDAALLGDGSGLAGEGELARLRFRVRAEGEPRLALAEVEGRDAQNQPVSIALLSSPSPPAPRAAIRYAYPNPFDRETHVEFTLAQRGNVRVGVYDVAGRHVRTLLDGLQDPGMRSASWDGRDENGIQREAGVYMIRIEKAGTRETRMVRMIR